MPPKRPPISREPSLLFTGFEPSGDDHASAVIAELRRRYPDLPMHCWGGPNMEAAGATLVERTGRDAVMGIPGPKKILEHVGINRRVKAWIRENNPTVHIPVDSPAANFPICKIAKQHGMRVMHLVAPQVWAWGSWRIRKLRKLTDRVLCLLPFEENWFRKRSVDADFVGHPLFDHAPPMQQIIEGSKQLPLNDADPGFRLALLPGSRPKELRKNFPLLLETFRAVQAKHPEAKAIVAATDPAALESLRAVGGTIPDSVEFVHGKTDEVIAWSTLAVVVSGTVTLQIARQAKPMVIFYQSDPLLYSLVGRWLLTTEFLTLPNLIASREIVPEFVPHFEGHEKITAEVMRLLESEQLRQSQSDQLRKVASAFEGKNAALGAADAIARIAGLPPVEATASAR